MEPTKAEIKAWLDKTGHSYEWLADKCLVSYGTIRNWMAKKPIPEKKIRLIVDLMENQPTSTEHPSLTENTLILKFSEEEWAIIKTFSQTFPSINLEDYSRTKIFELVAGMTEATASIIPLNEKRDVRHISGRGHAETASGA